MKFVYSKRIRYRIALHEAAHAVVGHYLNFSVQKIKSDKGIGYVNFDVDSDEYGRVFHKKEIVKNKKNFFYKYDLVALAGYVAEISMLPSSRKRLKKCRANSILDLCEVRENIVCRYENFENQIISIMLADVYRLVYSLKPEIRKVAKKLNECKKLNRKEFLYCLES